jgi:S-adenosylmethionine:tRNA ribosyltransferase-isomerase
MRTSDFDFVLPAELIAQEPAVERDCARLLVLHRATGRLEHRAIPDLLDFLNRGDVLVLNDSKVIPARLRGENAKTGGKFELLLLEENAQNDWWVMLRPGRRARVGTRIRLHSKSGETQQIGAEVLATNEEGHRRLYFNGTPNILQELDELGETPLPPYIDRERLRAEDKERYQTVFAQAAGSVAAPTAGLHFTRALLSKIEARGVAVCFVTLHVGLGTFAAVKTEMIESHKMHEESYAVSAETARAIGEAKRSGGRVIAAGTTSLRVLESVAARHEGTVAPGGGRTRAFIYPPCRFRIADGLLTNFHLPRSTLLMLVCAFAAPGEQGGRQMVLSAYAEAVRENYRFYSYGDAMLIL